jgi:hypothetical protein
MASKTRVKRRGGGRSFLWAAHCCAALATYPEVVTHRAGTSPPFFRSRRRPAQNRRSPGSDRMERKNGGVLPYLVLLRVGFALPPPLLAARCALTAPFHPYPAQPMSNEAVCFLWHFPSTALDGRRPDVIRHTALWSSDFPLPACARSDRPAQQLTELL